MNWEPYPCADSSGIRDLWLATMKPEYFSRYGFQPVSRWGSPASALLRKLRQTLRQPSGRWLPALFGRHTFMLCTLDSASLPHLDDERRYQNFSSSDQFHGRIIVDHSVTSVDVRLNVASTLIGDRSSKIKSRPISKLQTAFGRELASKWSEWCTKNPIQWA